MLRKYFNIDNKWSESNTSKQIEIFTKKGLDRMLALKKLKVIISKGKEKNVAKLYLPSGGVAITKISLASDQHARVNIVSKMFMARPSVFRYTLNTIDVFHG